MVTCNSDNRRQIRRRERKLQNIGSEKIARMSNARLKELHCVKKGIDESVLR